MTYCDCRIGAAQVRSKDLMLAIGFAMTCNVLYEIADVHAQLADRDTDQLVSALAVCDGYHSLSGFLHKFSLAREAVAQVPTLSDDRKDAISANLDQLQDLLVCSYGHDRVDAYLGKGRALVDLVRSAGDMLQMFSSGTRGPLDRSGLQQEVLALIESIRAHEDLPDRVKVALSLKLRSASRLLAGCGDYSDDEIRSYVKRVFADMAAEAEELDLTGSDTLKSVGKWAIRVCSGGAVGIGLLVDVPGAYALLEAPAIKFIEHLTD